MNRLDRFTDTDNKKRVNVGFALQILQRRLASSPAAIHNSLKRRKERLQAELDEARLILRGKSLSSNFENSFIANDVLNNIDEYGQDDIDYLGRISTTATTAETAEQLERKS